MAHERHHQQLSWHGSNKAAWRRMAKTYQQRKGEISSEKQWRSGSISESEKRHIKQSSIAYQ